MSRGVYIAHRSGARKWYPSCGNVLIESRMTWDLGYVRPRKYLTRSNESKAVRKRFLDVPRTTYVETTSFIPHSSHLTSNAQLSRVINSDRSRRYLTGQKVGSRCSALKWVGQLDRRNRPRVDFILHYAGRMNDDRIRRTEDWLRIIEGSIFNFLRFMRAPDIELSVGAARLWNISN